MGGLASRQKAITWTKFYQFQQAMYMKLWMMWPKICILIANILEMPLSCIKPVFKCSDNSGVCLRWTKLCCIVNEKPMAHQTLLMILQDVWWFVQNHQTYFLIIWKPFCQYSKLKCLSIFSKCLMICSLDILQIFHKGIMTIVMFYCLNSKNTHIYIYMMCFWTQWIAAIGHFIEDNSDSHIWQLLSLHNWRWKATVMLGWMGVSFSGSSSWPQGVPPAPLCVYRRFRSADENITWCGKFT